MTNRYETICEQYPNLAALALIADEYDDDSDLPMVAVAREARTVLARLAQVEDAYGMERISNGR
jgi:hypothetical protein